VSRSLWIYLLGHNVNLLLDLKIRLYSNVFKLSRPNCNSIVVTLLYLLKTKKCLRRYCKVTYCKLGVHMLSDEVPCLVDRMVERVRANRIVVCVSKIDTRNSSNSDKWRIVTAGAKNRYSTHNDGSFMKLRLIAQ